MAERRTITIAGKPVEVTEIEIVNRRKEQPNEYELEDGARIRVSNPAMVVYRVEGPVDPEGNPTYLIKAGTSTVVVHGPRKPDGQDNGGSTTGNT